MGLWPFGRKKSIRSNARGGAQTTEQGGLHSGRGVQELATHNGGNIINGGPERRQSRRDRKRRSSREFKKIRKDSRAYSFSPGRNDSIRVDQDQERPPVPPLPLNYKNKGERAQTDLHEIDREKQNLFRSGTQPNESVQWERMPTLHKKSPGEVARRKSSKRKKEDQEREAEIKAMTALMPVRPDAELPPSGRLRKHDSRKVRGAHDSPHRKSDDISLPEAGSIHSSLSGSEHPASYKLSPFDMLAPRPTIRYADHPRYIPPSNGIERSGSKKRRISERVNVPEATVKPHKRINELADDLDASELRELMERDQKRRDKKKIAERIRTEKRIARRQEKQKQEEDRAAREGTPPPANLERGVMGRQVVGLGIGTSAVVTSSKRRTSVSPGDTRHGSDHFERNAQESSVHTNAFDVATPASDRSDPIIETAQVARMSRASMSPPASPKGHAREASNISEMIDLARLEATQPDLKNEEKVVQQPVPIQNNVVESDSRRNSSTQRSSWTSFFKRRSKQSNRGPVESSFSNTSRDSMLSSQQGPSFGYAPMKTNSNLPKRTMSKFREDLPELPISPPDSRVQSPEADVAPETSTNVVDGRTRHRSSTDDSRMRYDTPTSGFRSIDALRARNETPTSGRTDAPSPEHAIVSQSLASIDSEGSWLSGKRNKRGSDSNAAHVPRDSANSLQKRFHQYNESSEELGIAEDEYFSRLSPEPERYRDRRVSGNPVPSSDEDEGTVASPTPSEAGRTKWGAVGRTPTVVHRNARIKSREGLLHDFQNDSMDDVTPAPSVERRRSYGFGKEWEGEGIQRARSVDLVRGHIRQISAGSAKLLDLKPRDSTDAKRRSQA